MILKAHLKEQYLKIYSNHKKRMTMSVFLILKFCEPIRQCFNEDEKRDFLRLYLMYQML